MTANAFIWSYIAMPHTPQEHAVAMRVAPPPPPVLPSLIPSDCGSACLLAFWLVHYKDNSCCWLPLIACFSFTIVLLHVCAAWFIDGVCSVDDCISCSCLLACLLD